jgi:hypothetical protein
MRLAVGKKICADIEKQAGLMKKGAGLLQKRAGLMKKRAGLMQRKFILCRFPLHILPLSGPACNETELILRFHCTFCLIFQKNATEPEEFLFSVAHFPISA